MILEHNSIKALRACYLNMGGFSGTQGAVHTHTHGSYHLELECLGLMYIKSSSLEPGQPEEWVTLQYSDPMGQARAGSRLTLPTQGDSRRNEGPEAKDGVESWKSWQPAALGAPHLPSPQQEGVP